MPGKSDMIPPARTKGVPPRVRGVRPDMIHDIHTKLTVPLLDVLTWTMARSAQEKMTMLKTAQPEDLIVVVPGTKWTDFFEFTPDNEGREVYEQLTDTFNPRHRMMLTSEEVIAVEAWRAGRG